MKAIVPTAIFVVLLTLGSEAALSTHSFTNKAGRGSHPSTIVYTYGGARLTIDISALAGATVYKAIFNPNRRYGNEGSGPQGYESRKTMTLVSAADDTLALIGPRFCSFDATAAIQHALARGTICTLNVRTAAGLFRYGEMLELDVTCDLAAAASIEQVDSAAARFKDGDAMITFKEVNSPFTADSVSCSDYTTYYNRVFGTGNGTDTTADWAGRTEKIRYKIYRSLVPFTGEQPVIDAELIDEIRPLSCWNTLYYGGGNCTGALKVKRHPVQDNVTALPGTGIYVRRHHGTAGETAYYLISRVVDGAEDFSSIISGENATNSVSESTGPGMVVRNGSLVDGDNVTRNYFVKWECWPATNKPSYAFDYMVAVPQNVTARPMVCVGLHGSTGSMHSGWGWMYRLDEGGIFVSTNLDPYHWWLAYHENYHTLKNWDSGTTQPFSVYRVLSFLYDFAVPTYTIDTTRMMVAGVSMGGTGSSQIGLRSGHIFSNVVSWVGVHLIKNSPQYSQASFAYCGDSSWHMPYSNEILQRFGYPLVTKGDGIDYWTYWDNRWWLQNNPQAELPWMSVANGENDGGIGWPQAWKFAKACNTARAPYNFDWGQGGHSQRVVLLDGTDRLCGLDFRRGQSLPAFSECTINGNLGPDTNSADVGTGDASGNHNRYFKWDVNTVVDQPGQWEMSMWLIASASAPVCTVNVTPRRLQQLEHGAGSLYTWEWRQGTTVIASGTATADQDGIFTIPGIEMSKTQRRLYVTCDNCITTGTGRATRTSPPSILAAPNPFNPSIQIALRGGEISETGKAAIKIYNASGTMVCQMQADRSHLRSGIAWDASNFGSGMYIVRMAIAGHTLSRKIVLAR